MPLAPVSKSIWSSCIEALCEYCRIVWDIFPADKLLRFIVSDCESKLLNSWLPEEQTMAHVSLEFAISAKILNCFSYAKTGFEISICPLALGNVKFFQATYFTASLARLASSY